MHTFTCTSLPQCTLSLSLSCTLSPQLPLSYLNKHNGRYFIAVHHTYREIAWLTPYCTHAPRGHFWAPSMHSNLRGWPWSFMHALWLLTTAARKPLSSCSSSKVKAQQELLQSLICFGLALIMQYPKESWDFCMHLLSSTIFECMYVNGTESLRPRHDLALS